jgi:predicted transcriptional regulator of viral defense system
MIVSRLSNYLREHRRASLNDIAQGISASPEALEAMLSMLERKGRVRRLESGASCGQSCCKCDPTALVIYEWVND